MITLNKRKREYFFEFIILTIGAAVAAVALNAFLIPNTILDGGVVGISMIVSKLTNFSLSILILLINIPFVYIGYKNLGKGFLVRTIYAMIIFAIILEKTNNINPITEEMLLATVFGGAMLGIGVGLILKSGGCIDGTESVAIVLNKKTNFSVGQIILLFNLIIYSTAGFLFGLDRALYSILTYFITYQIIDMVSSGFEEKKAAIIITSKESDMSSEIFKRLGRTTTKINGKGHISGEKDVLYLVLTRIEIFELKKIIKDTDERAFVTISEISDIIGEHIKHQTKKS